MRQAYKVQTVRTWRPLKTSSKRHRSWGGRRGPGAKVILFGSHARDQARRHSDVDFLVLKKRVTDPIGDAVHLRSLLRGLGPVDIVVMSLAEADDWSGVPNTLAHDALAGGRVLVET